jgi:hypothetical protein
MSLFKFLTGKSSREAPVEQPEQRVANSTLTDKVEELRSKLNILDDELRDIVDHQNALQAQLVDLEDLMINLGPEEESFPVFIYPGNGALN